MQGIATYFVNGEKLSWADFVGAVVLLAGMVTVIASSSDNDGGGTEDEKRGGSKGATRSQDQEDQGLLLEMQEHTKHDV